MHRSVVILIAAFSLIGSPALGETPGGSRQNDSNGEALSTAAPALRKHRLSNRLLLRRPLLRGLERHREEPRGAALSLQERSRRATSAPAIVARGPFTSVQVNVNGNGNNVVGDASNEPSIAVDPTNPGVMAIGWRHFDTIASDFRQAGIGYSSDGGQTWTFPDVLDRGQFRSDPVLGSDANGVFYFSSLSTLDSVDVFRSFDGGQTWGLPVSAFGGDKQWIAIDLTSGIGAGNLYQIWNVQFGAPAGFDFTRTTDQAVSFEGPYVGPVSSMKWGTMDVGPDGTLYLGGLTQDGFSHLFSISTDAQNPAVAPTFSPAKPINLGGVVAVFGALPNPAGLLGHVWIKTDQSGGPTNGNLYMLESADPPGPDPLDVMLIRSEDGGTTWSDPVRVNDDDPSTNAWQWFGTMSVAPNGRLDVVWNDTRNSGEPNLCELYYAFSMDAGRTWSENVPLTPEYDSHVGWPVQRKMGDYYEMISDVDGANLAYAATFNGEQDVYFLRIPADCNENGFDDSDDIATQRSTDCDGNGIPDGCQPDCNGNGQADRCDIAVGVSDDCNRDGIPDTCNIGFDCSVIVVGSAEERCLPVSIEPLTGVNEAGEVFVADLGAPERIRVDVLNSSCAPGASFELFLNGVSLGTGDPDPVELCSCAATVHSVEFTNSALIASAWNVAGNNTLRYVITGGAENLAWVRAVLSSGPLSETVCIFDDPSDALSGCDRPNLCVHTLLTSPVDVSRTIVDPFLAPTVSTPFSQSRLPSSVDISTLSGGDYEVCVWAREELSAPPAGITFESLVASCAAGGTLQFFLNGVSMGVTDADPTDGCSCDTPIQQFVVTNPGLLSAWNVGGANTLRVVVAGASELVAWLRVRIQQGLIDETVCIFDTGSSCVNAGLCGHSFVSSPLDVSADAAFERLVACKPFTKGDESLLKINEPCFIPIPTTSAWGLIVLALLVLTAGAILLTVRGTHPATCEDRPEAYGGGRTISKGNRLSYPRKNSGSRKLE